jgi:hypothetical protein
LALQGSRGSTIGCKENGRRGERQCY